MTADASGRDFADRVASATQAVYIKLGAGGGWTDSCIEAKTMGRMPGRAPFSG